MNMAPEATRPPREAIKPLEWPVDFENLNQVEAFFADFPIVGARARCARKLRVELKARGPQCEELWPDDNDVWDVLGFLTRYVRDMYSVPNACLIPDDPIDIVLWDSYDGLATVELIVEIEEEISVDLDDEFIEESCKSKLTLGEWIDRIGEIRNE